MPKIYNGSTGFTSSEARIDRCKPESLGCVSSESGSENYTDTWSPQTVTTIAEIRSNLRRRGVDWSTLAVGDTILFNLIPTNSFFVGGAVYKPCDTGFEFDLVSVKLNGVDANGNPALVTAALPNGFLKTTAFSTVAGVTTATQTIAASAAIPNFAGVHDTTFSQKNETDANYFGAFGGIGLTITKLPPAADACQSTHCAKEDCTVFTVDAKNLRRCHTSCSNPCADGTKATVFVTA